MFPQWTYPHFIIFFEQNLFQIYYYLKNMILLMKFDYYSVIIFIDKNYEKGDNLQSFF